MNYLTRLLSHVDKTSLVKYSQNCKFSIISVLNSGTRENINIGTIGNIKILLHFRYFFNFIYFYLY